MTLFVISAKLANYLELQYHLNQPFNHLTYQVWEHMQIAHSTITTIFREWRTSTTLNCSNMLVDEHLEDV